MHKPDEMPSVLGVMGIEAKAVDDVEYKLENAPMKKQICICGHGMLRHEEVMPQRWSCISGKMYCPCQYPRAVLLVGDARRFIRKTEGIGPAHALARGIRALEKSGSSAVMLVPPVCQKCGSENGPIVPAAVNRLGLLSTKPERLNVLICQVCISEMTY